ncbi:MAG TPA: tol-pal system protein YbgF [Stellaceae bacterium]|nr:tol-pal system protein YbgF [Stellaceae bacterium]
MPKTSISIQASEKDLTTMRSTAAAVALCGLAACLVGGTLRAQTPQNSDLRPLLERLDRLERDMNLLQRQVYRGTSPNGAPVALSPPDSTSAVNYEVRFGQIDDQMRTITGQIEELNYAIDQMKHRLETLSSDLDQRLTTLEHGSAGAGAPNVAAGSPSPPPRGAGANPAQPASQSGTLGQLPAARDEQTAAATTTAAPGAGASPQEQYNYAFGLLRQANYPAAEQALRSFIQRYPNDQLAGNAQYWLGETFFVRKDYNSAAAVFAEGYQKYPKGGKAADNLLKLGMSLGNLGQKADACRAYSRLDRDFPNSPSKERAVEEKKKLGC